MDTTIGLESNNLNYNTRTGGTHRSTVHNVNTHRTDRILKKGTIDLETVNSHWVAGGTAGGRAAGGHGGMGGQDIIHQQAPRPLPESMTSTELLAVAIGSTLAVILIIIASAIMCHSVYRDQHRSF